MLENVTTDYDMEVLGKTVSVYVDNEKLDDLIRDEYSNEYCHIFINDNLKQITSIIIRVSPDGELYNNYDEDKCYKIEHLLRNGWKHINGRILKKDFVNYKDELFKEKHTIYTTVEDEIPENIHNHYIKELKYSFINSWEL